MVISGITYQPYLLYILMDKTNFHSKLETSSESYTKHLVLFRFSFCYVYIKKNDFVILTEVFLTTVSSL